MKLMRLARPSTSKAPVHLLSARWGPNRPGHGALSSMSSPYAVGHIVTRCALLAAVEGWREAMVKCVTNGNLSNQGRKKRRKQKKYKKHAKDGGYASRYDEEKPCQHQRKEIRREGSKRQIECPERRFRNGAMVNGEQQSYNDVSIPRDRGAIGNTENFAMYRLIPG